MAKSLVNARIFAGGADLTSASNKVDLSGEVEDKEVTNFGSIGTDGRVWKEIIAGLGSAKISAAGQWEAGDLSKVDDQAWQNRGAVNAWTVAIGGNVGDLAYLTKALESKYTIGGSPGDVAPWQADATGSWALVRGQIMHPPGTARSANGTGTARQLGAIATGKALYVCLHVLSVAGTASPSLTVTVESDDASGFASPTTVATFTAATAISDQALSVAGPTTDAWFRITWAVTGTTPSFLFVVSAGIA